MKMEICVLNKRVTITSNFNIDVEPVFTGFVNLETILVRDDGEDNYWHICRQFQYTNTKMFDIGKPLYERVDIPGKVLVHANCDAIAENGTCSLCSKEAPDYIFDELMKK